MPLVNIYMREGTTPEHRRNVSLGVHYAAIRKNLRLFADVPEEEILLCVVETNSENWWAAGRTVDPVTGYDERMDHVLGNTGQDSEPSFPSSVQSAQRKEGGSQC